MKCALSPQAGQSAPAQLWVPRGVFAWRPSQGPALPPGSADSLCPQACCSPPVQACLSVSVCLPVCLSPSDRCPELDASVVSAVGPGSSACRVFLLSPPCLSWPVLVGFRSCV